MELSMYLNSTEFFNALKFFQHNKMGWIINGRFIPCSLHEHFSILEKETKYSNLIKTLRKLEEQSQEDEAIFLDGHGPDDHVGWHAYSSDSQDAIPLLRNYILSLAYQDGWVRIGTFPSRFLCRGEKYNVSNKKGKSEFALEVEGMHLTPSDKELVETIAVSLDMPYITKKIDNTKNNITVTYIDSCLERLNLNKKHLWNFGLFEYQETTKEEYDNFIGVKLCTSKTKYFVFKTTPWGTPIDYEFLNFYYSKTKI